jgi:hypothetical protein
LVGVKVEQVHRFLLSLPEVAECEHGGLPSFRVRGKRFASMLDDQGVNLMPGEETIRSAVHEWPQWCHEERMGSRLVAVRVGIPAVDQAVLQELASEAWAAKAPTSLVRRHAAESAG